MPLRYRSLLPLASLLPGASTRRPASAMAAAQAREDRVAPRRSILDTHVITVEDLPPQRVERTVELNFGDGRSTQELTDAVQRQGLVDRDAHVTPLVTESEEIVAQRQRVTDAADAARAVEDAALAAIRAQIPPTEALINTIRNPGDESGNVVLHTIDPELARLDIERFAANWTTAQDAISTVDRFFADWAASVTQAAIRTELDGMAAQALRARQARITAEAAEAYLQELLHPGVFAREHGFGLDPAHDPAHDPSTERPEGPPVRTEVQRPALTLGTWFLIGAAGAAGVVAYRKLGAKRAGAKTPRKSA